MPFTIADIKGLKGFGVADLLVLVLLVALLGGLLAFGQLWAQPYTAKVSIDLAPAALWGYCLLSLARNTAAYFISLALTFWLGRWAARDRRAERFIIPLVDIFQSIPMLGFMPGLVLALVHVFPSSRVGLELSGILLIVTSQAWNMIFAFYQSTKAIPAEMEAACDKAGFKPWQRFLRLELPYGMTPLIWNSMMSMAGGWFFVTVNEAFVLGDRDFRLPGVGSYMSVAMERGDTRAMVWAVVAMAIVVVAADQLVWRPLLTWSYRFRVDDTPVEVPRSWMFDLVKRSRAMQGFLESMGRRFLSLVQTRIGEPVRRVVPRPVRDAVGLDRVNTVLGVGILALLAVASWRLLDFLWTVPSATWAELARMAGLSLARTVSATLLGSLWAIPLGIAIGMNPRWAKVMQPVIQIAASYPAPMLFPAILVVLFALGVPLDYGSVVLMMSGTSWYILFNTIAGASQVSQEQKDLWAAYGSRGFRRYTRFILPAIFPSLLVGWETAMGGAWNASIVTEYFRLGGVTHTAHGLGAAINLATERADYPTLTAAVFLMAVLVVAINRLVWHRLSEHAARTNA